MITEIFYHLRYIITKICTNITIATALEDKLLLALLTNCLHFIISEMRRSKVLLLYGTFSLIKF